MRLTDEALVHSFMRPARTRPQSSRINRRFPELRIYLRQLEQKRLKLPFVLVRRHYGLAVFQIFYLLLEFLRRVLLAFQSGDAPDIVQASAALSTT